MAKKFLNIKTDGERYSKEIFNIIKDYGGKDGVKYAANQLKIPQDFARTIYNQFNLGQILQTYKDEQNKKNFLQQQTDYVETSTEKLIPVIKKKEKVSEEQKAINKEAYSTTKRRSNKPISDDKKIAIASDYENMTAEEVAKKYNVSISSVGRIAIELGVKKNKSRIKEKSSLSLGLENEKKSSIIKASVGGSDSQISSVEKKNDTNKNVSLSSRLILDLGLKVSRLKGSSIISAGLCADRHQMPVNLFIYNNITDKEMFDFTYLYDRAIKFIEDNKIKENKKSLHVYVTGLQVLLGAITAACNDKQVNLTLYHYNTSTEKFVAQKVFIYYPEEVGDTREWVNITSLDRDLYIEDSLNSKIDLGEKFYTITINILNEYGENTGRSVLFIENLETALFKAMPEFTKEILKIKTKACVTLNESNVRNNRLYWGRSISKSYNYISSQLCSR